MSDRRRTKGRLLLWATLPAALLTWLIVELIVTGSFPEWLNACLSLIGASGVSGGPHPISTALQSYPETLALVVACLAVLCFVPAALVCWVFLLIYPGIMSGPSRVDEDVER